MSNSSANNQYVSVTAPARLHLGFVDLNGSLGRKFVSLGLAIDGIQTELVATRHPRFEASGPDNERALACARRLYEKWNLEKGCKLIVKSSIPPHTGLGSGTQMALAVGHAICKLWNIPTSPEIVADTLNRGGRSGIGIAAFTRGGFIVDGGRGNSDKVPPMIARLPFPDAWRILLILDHGHTGLHGTNESNAFSTLKPFHNRCADYLSRQVLVRVLPGLAEQDLHAFGAGVREIQKKIGDYFAPAQGGRYTSQSVADVIAYLIAQGVTGVGQSSWGPTGFAFFDSDTRAHAMLRELQNQFSSYDNLSFKVVTGSNTGCEIRDGEIDCAVGESMI